MRARPTASMPATRSLVIHRGSDNTNSRQLCRWRSGAGGCESRWSHGYAAVLMLRTGQARLERDCRRGSGLSKPWTGKEAARPSIGGMADIAGAPSSRAFEAGGRARHPTPRVAALNARGAAATGALQGCTSLRWVPSVPSGAQGKRRPHGPCGRERWPRPEYQWRDVNPDSACAATARMAVISIVACRPHEYRRPAIPPQRRARRTRDVGAPGFSSTAFRPTAPVQAVGATGESFNVTV